MKKLILALALLCSTFAFAGTEKSDKGKIGAVPVFAGTSHYIQLTWVQSTSTAVVQTNVYRAVSTNSVCGAYSQVGTVTPATTVTYNDNTAVQGTTYCYVVRAFNGIDESGDSNVATATIPFPPQAPTGLGATPKP